MKTIITADSFGSECPANWEEIATALNEIIEERNIADNCDATDELWEAFCCGELESVPTPIMKD